MTYDFSSSEKRLAFIKKLQDATTWGEPLPNLKWISHTEFVHHGFFIYSDWHMFVRRFGGNGKSANVSQWPSGFGQPPTTQVHARCFIIADMCGYVLLPDTRYKPTEIKTPPYYGWKGKLFIAKFRFCVHKMQTKKLGRCLNEYTCTECGFQHVVDSSD